MIARITLVSNFDTEIISESKAVSVSGAQLGEQNPNTNGQGVSHRAMLQDPNNT